MGKILGIGIPIEFQDGLIQVAFIIITIIANQRGLNDAAAVVRLGGQYLRGYIFDCIFAGIHFSFSGFFAHAGNPACRFYTIFSLLY